MAFDLQTTLGSALTEATRIAFEEGKKMVPMGGRAIYNYEKSDTLTKVVDSSIFDKFASSTGFGENYAVANPTKGDQKTYTQAKHTLSFEMVKEIEGFANASNGYDIVKGIKGAQGLGTAALKRMELDLQLNIGFGAGASYVDRDGNTIATTAADGLANFHSAHTVNGSSATFSNLGSTAFGQTGLEAAELLFRSFINHDGMQVDARPTAIFSTRTPALVNLIKEYSKSMDHVEDANRGLNTYQGKYDHIVLEYLDSTNAGAVDSTKANYWGLVDAKNSNLKLFVSGEPQIYAPELVQRNRNVLVQTDVVFSYGLHDASCICLMQA
jgi:hypothetical protein